MATSMSARRCASSRSTPTSRRAICSSTGQQFGDAHLTANTEGAVLRTRLEANFANSAIRGDGDLAARRRLSGQRHGHFLARRFRAVARVDLARPESRRPDRFTGFAEGEMRIEGPALKPEAMKAELRLPKLEIGPTPAAGVPSALHAAQCRTDRGHASPTPC